MSNYVDPEDIGPWEVQVYNFGSGIHVAPVKGVMSVECWGRLRREYPKNDKQLRKAIAACEEWCRRRNAKDADTAAMAERVMGDS